MAETEVISEKRAGDVEAQAPASAASEAPEKEQVCIYRFILLSIVIELPQGKACICLLQNRISQDFLRLTQPVSRAFLS